MFSNEIQIDLEWIIIYSIGQKLPYPGNCHDYYVCFADGNGSDHFHVQVFSCGDDWVYDPNTGSCTWPEEAADDLCDY